MTGKVVNLRAVRKDRARADRRAEGDANAARHGRSRAQKAAEDADRARVERNLDQHERE
ncbi:DUF4169 family protein [Jannaschia sp. Os4]|uniref:DUF4169 family protein n=1 Tax=Jannaschia sp. Os4 TaxID=2807617 RepID=UPI0019395493|nr:DUF4169 family protein [Jannaschia sp. Os4]